MGFHPPRKVIKAGHAAIAAWTGRVRKAQEQADAIAAETARNHRGEVVKGVAETVDLASARGEEAEVTKAGLITLERDGLMWLLKKRKILPAHYDAGLKFRGDFELANGTGVKSQLAELSGVHANPSSAGPTDAMLYARARMREALAALGTPRLHRYANGVAGEGRMLSDPVFTSDPTKAFAHLEPTIIALDLLARHYGMLK